MAVDLILLEDVDGLGSIGDQIRVAEGHARNFLLPKKLAAPVTTANLRRLATRKLRMQQDHEDRIEVAKAMADKIAKMSITLPVEAAENDKLYGSVSQVQIAEALEADGISIDRHCVVLEDAIKELGVYSVEINLHEQVQTTLKVWIVRA